MSIYKSQKNTPETYTTIIKIKKATEKKFDWGTITFVEAVSPITHESEKPKLYSYKHREKDNENKVHWSKHLKEENTMTVFVVKKGGYLNIYPALNSFSPIKPEDL